MQYIAFLTKVDLHFDIYQPFALIRNWLAHILNQVHSSIVTLWLRGWASTIPVFADSLYLWINTTNYHM